MAYTHPVRGTVTRYRFGSRTVDLDTVEIRDGDSPLELEPQAFAVLSHLVRHRHRVVPKTELLDHLWGSRFVSESALTTQIKQCRRAVGDDGRRQALIRTVHGVGYQFVADVEEQPGDRSAGPGGWSGPWPIANRPFFGRHRERAALAERVSGHRLVTVTGLGGVGKSALTARLLTGEIPVPANERWWCELGSIRDPGALATVVLSAMGEGQQADADPVESVLRTLRHRRALLVLDNCEHLAEAAASFADAVLRRCPAVRIVATGRVPLDVVGESILPLGPLRVEDATACFCSRARDAGGELDPTDPSVMELCRRLDGIPLALELAAARTRTLTPAQMVQLLKHRFRLLADPAADDADRQRSLQRIIQWSWDAMSSADRQLLASLSVMVGSFTLDDAAAVSAQEGDVVDLADALGRLVQASLLVPVSGSGARQRFRLLESIQVFAAERLTEPLAVRKRHSRHFAARAQEIDDGALQSDDIDHGLREMREMWDNLRTSVQYADDTGDGETLLRIIRAVGPVADFYQAYEVLDWCDRATLDVDDAPDATKQLVADAVAIQGRLLAHRGEIDRARSLVEGAYAHHPSHITTLSVIWYSYYAGDFDRVIEGASRLRVLSRSERGMDVAFAEGFEAVVAMVRGELMADHVPVHPSTAANGVLGTLDCFADGLRLRSADPSRSAELLEAVIAVSLSNDYRLLLGAAASMLSQATLPTQPTVDAMRSLRRTLTMYRERGMERMINTDIVVAARLLNDAGASDDAIRLLGSYAASGYTHVGMPEQTRIALTDELEAADPVRFARLSDEGARWNPRDAADAAIAALDHHICSGLDQ